MNHNFNNNDIEDFLQGRMDEARRQKFLKAIEQDEALRNEVETMQASDKVKLYLRKEALMEKMAQWQKEEEEENEKKIPVGGAKIIPIGFRRILAIAASLALLLVAAYFFTRKDNKPDFVETPPVHPTDTIKALPENQSPSPILEEKIEEVTTTEKKEVPAPTPKPKQRKKPNDYKASTDEGIALLDKSTTSELMSANTRDTSLDARAAKFYQEGKYANVVALYHPNPSVDFSYLYALSLYKLRRYREAVAAFDSIQNDLRRGYDAQWGAVLSLTAQLPTSCKALSNRFKEIEGKETHTYHQKAQKLKEEIGFDKLCGQ